MIPVLIILSVFNLFVAIGIRAFLSESWKPLVQSRITRIILLIPPLSIILLVGIVIVGMVWTVGLLVADYLS